MQKLKLYIGTALVAGFMFTSCADKKTETSTTSTPVDNNFQGITLTDSGTIKQDNQTNTNPPLVQPDPNKVAQPIATAGVQHYTCPNNCKGSGSASQGTCPVCGTAYQHNQAFHNQPGAANTPATKTTIQPGVTQSDPTQNAKGIYHYTCPKGCKGGAGAAGPCATCGTTLAHNQAYHQ